MTTENTTIPNAANGEYLADLDVDVVLHLNLKGVLLEANGDPIHKEAEQWADGDFIADLIHTLTTGSTPFLKRTDIVDTTVDVLETRFVK